MMCVGLLALKGKLFCTLACAQTYTSVPQPMTLPFAQPFKPITADHSTMSRQKCTVLWLGEYIQGEGRRPRVL